MGNKKLSLFDYQIFLLKAFFILGLVWTGFILALLGFFYAYLIWFFAAICGVFLVRAAIARNVRLIPSAEMMIASAIIALVAIIFLSFSTPTVFSGRDQGSISEAAIRLAQNHTIKFTTPASDEFFKIYGPGRALNFPGFYYTEAGQLTSQFPLVYIVWLALFFAVFGIAGFAVANGLLLFFFLLSLYLLMRLFLRSFSACLTIAFAATSFVFMWFSKFTLSENMASPMLWLSILSLVLFLRNPRKLYYDVFLLSMALLCFTRIEGFAFFIASIIIVASSKDARAFVRLRMSRRFFLPIVSFAAILILNAIQDVSFYIELAKALIPDALPKAQQLGTMKNIILPHFYVEKIFYLYGLLWFFALGAFGAAIQVFKKDLYKLVPFFVVSPTFIYFLNSHITLDHPWMLRRFAFSLLPVAIFYTGLLIGEQIEKNQQDKQEKRLRYISILVAIILIAGNLAAFSRYFTFSENKNLLAQVDELSGQFSSNDLILVDRETADDGWAMISGPMSFLNGKNSVYFFNTQDLAKLDLERFGKIYLITPDRKVNYYSNSTIGERLTPIRDYDLEFSKLNTSQSDPLKKIEFPEKKDFTVSGKIFEVSK